MKYIIRSTEEQNVQKGSESMPIKELRLKAGLTQEQTSKLTGLSIKFISEMENGRRNPSDNSKNKLAKAYRTTPVEIFLACQRTKRSKERRI